jgi:hypothetical protein
MVEPMPDNLEVGRKNFESNGSRESSYRTRSALVLLMSGSSAPIADRSDQYAPRRHPGLGGKHSERHFQMFIERRINVLFLSTHSEEIEKACRRSWLRQATTSQRNRAWSPTRPPKMASSSPMRRIWDFPRFNFGGGASGDRSRVPEGRPRVPEGRHAPRERLAEEDGATPSVSTARTGADGASGRAPRP